MTSTRNHGKPPCFFACNAIIVSDLLDRPADHAAMTCTNYHAVSTCLSLVFGLRVKSLAWQPGAGMRLFAPSG